MKKSLLIGLFLLLWSLWGASTVTKSLAELPWEGKMPLHKELGLLSDPSAGNNLVAAKTQQAFTTFYGPLWFEEYVTVTSRRMLNKLYDPFLSKTLPAKVLIGETQRAGNQYTVSIILEGALGKTKATVVWIEEEKKGLMITSFSFL